MAQRDRGVGIVGSRTLPESYRDHIKEVVRYLFEQGYHIHSGGAVGADQFALEAVISLDICYQSVIFSPWVAVGGFPRSVRPSIHDFISYGGRMDWGHISPKASGRGVIIAGLLARNIRLVKASSGIVAFLHGKSSGTKRTISEATRSGKRVVVFLCGDGASLPSVKDGSWIPIGGSSAFAGAYMFLTKTKRLEDAHHKKLPILACDAHRLAVA